MEIKIKNIKFNVDIANTFRKRLFGLMGQKEISKGLFLPKCKSIHTFLMKDNIDIIMIDKENKVIYFEKNVPKNRIIIKKKAYHTIELPKNSLDNISINDKLNIKN